MFNLDKWQEIFATMARNPLRVTLTAFSVSWGIFMLCILLGFATGLQNGVENDFKSDAVNSLWASAGRTSMPYQGLKPGRVIRFTNDDYEALGQHMDGVEHVASRKDFWGMTTDIRYKNNYASFMVMGCAPNYRFLESLTITHGRFINEQDYNEGRKVVALGKIAKDLLFDAGEDAIGKYIYLNGIMFKVVGVFTDPGGDRDMRRLYMPITTSQQVFGDPGKLNSLSMITSEDITLAESTQMEKDLTKLLQERHQVNPEDTRAIRIWNNLENFMQFRNLFLAIKYFMWAIGFMTILIGIIGVGNIMVITVKERTREIGIRKAMGATPFSIISMILQEAILITVVAGYMGLIAGVGLIELIASFIPESQPSMDGSGGGGAMNFLGKPEVDFTAAVAATIILIVCGTIAGLIPAMRAANINPIKAIRNE